MKIDSPFKMINEKIMSVYKIDEEHAICTHHRAVPLNALIYNAIQ